jgi:hypothetical protein
MTDQLKKVKACGICKIVTDDGVNTAPCHCPKNTDPLKELEEWLRTEREKASFNTGILAPDTATWRMAQVSTLTIILAKIAEMRENKDV